MDRLKITLYDFSTLFGDIVPFVTDVEVDLLVKNLVDDINGLFSAADAAITGEKIDVDKIGNTLYYLTTSSNYILSDDSRRFLIKATINLLTPFIEEFLQQPLQVNYRFKYISNKAYTDGSMNVVLERYRINNFTPEAAEEQLVFAQRILHVFANSAT